MRAAEAATPLIVADGSRTPTGWPGLTRFAVHATSACVGDGTDGPRVQLLYVRTADQPSAYTANLGTWLREAARTDDHLAASTPNLGPDGPLAPIGTGTARRVRWATDANCVPTVLERVLPAGSYDSAAAFYAAVDDLDLPSTDRRYLAYVDTEHGPGSGDCGWADTIGDDRPGPENVANTSGGHKGWVFRSCWDSLGGVSTTTHELFHTLGAVQNDAPHATPGAHCTQRRDQLCRNDTGTNTMSDDCVDDTWPVLLDCGGDDYYNTDPPAGTWLAQHWNIANSVYLTPGPPMGPTTVTDLTVTGPGPVEPDTDFTLTAHATTTTAETGNDGGDGTDGADDLLYAWKLPNTCQVVDGESHATVTVRCTRPATVLPFAVAAAAANTYGPSATYTTQYSSPPKPYIFETKGPTRLAVDETGSFTAYTTYSPPGGDNTWTAPDGCAATSGGPLNTEATLRCDATRAGDDVTLTVTSRQDDGQTATHQFPVHITDHSAWTPLRAAYPTDPTARTEIRLTARLLDSDTAALSGADVQLWAAPPGSPLEWVRTLTTDTAGATTTVLRPTTRLVVQWRYPGSADIESSQSATRTLLAPTRTTAAWRQNRQLLLGRVRDAAGTNLRGRTVRLQRYSSGAWRTVSSATTTRDGVRFRPQRRGTFRLVYAGSRTKHRSVSAVLRR